MIDNILLGGKEGFEKEFVDTIRKLVRLEKCNVQSEPSTSHLSSLPDKDLLSLACLPNVFMGESFVYNTVTRTRQVCNSNKTLAKPMLSSELDFSSFSYRSMAAYISLLLYSLHTLNINAASAFFAMRLYRGIGVAVSKSGDWDGKLKFVCPKAQEEIKKLSKTLIENKLATIPDPHPHTYDENDYDELIFVDASKEGWGAVRKQKNAPTRCYQQKFIHYLHLPQQPKQKTDTSPFSSRFSAHAEPTAIRLLLTHLLKTEESYKEKKIAITRPL
eukprot:CAMPEP_0176429468 /NCGR_PEP_ID=MMETSP0127-20121128/13727_1 /TAXON_ID=938130 /ORGANISM="Platyophrya macrostoma, Strain WH" /LENGTH=273 /DNA_ID=CAMNT_0017811275 /DNA_START=1 /DNA_END=822 /DNA_ORIENTATION=-